MSSGKKESVEVLLEKGASAEAKDSGDVTPLMLAAHYGRAQIATLLLQRGARVHPMAEYANTPLHSAAESGHLNIVDLLISKGADVNRQDERCTLIAPLCWAHFRAAASQHFTWHRSVAIATL